MSRKTEVKKLRKSLSKLLKSVDKTTDMSGKNFGNISDLIKLRRRLVKFIEIDEKILKGER